jgi:hypothetical protein
MCGSCRRDVDAAAAIAAAAAGDRQGGQVHVRCIFTAIATTMSTATTAVGASVSVVWC